MKGRTITEYLPESKLGTAVAGAYLLLVFFLLMVTAFGGRGLHSGTGMTALFAVILTLPLSWVVGWITDFLGPAPTYEQVDYLLLVMLAVCAVINAGVIYLVVGFVSRASRVLFRKLLK